MKLAFEIHLPDDASVEQRAHALTCLSKAMQAARHAELRAVTSIPPSVRALLPSEGDSWFVRALKRFNANSGFKTQKEFADFLGTYPSKLNKWLGGAMPPAEDQERLLRLMGGDIERAMPGWTPADPTPSSEDAANA